MSPATAIDAQPFPPGWRGSRCQPVAGGGTHGLPSVGQGKSSGGSGSYSSRCSSRRSVPPVRSPGHDATTSPVSGSKHRTRRLCPSAWTYRVSVTFSIATPPDPTGGSLGAARDRTPVTAAAALGGSGHPVV